MSRDAKASRTAIRTRLGQLTYHILQQISTDFPWLISTSGLKLRQDCQMFQFSQSITPVTVVTHILVPDQLIVPWVFSLIPSSRAVHILPLFATKDPVFNQVSLCISIIRQVDIRLSHRVLEQSLNINMILIFTRILVW